MPSSSRHAPRGARTVLAHVTRMGIVAAVATASVSTLATPGGGPTPVAAPARRPAVAASFRSRVAPPNAAIRPVHRVLLIGDSLAESLVPGLETSAAADGVQLASRAYGGCGLLTGLPLDLTGQPYPFSQACNDSRPAWQSQGVQDFQPDLVLWLGAAWDERDRIVNGAIAQLGTVAGDHVIMQLIDESARRLTATGARLVIVTSAPDRGSQLAADPLRNLRLAALNRLLRLYAVFHQIQVVDLTPIVCPGRGPACPEAVNGVLMRPDGYHLGPSASPLVAARMLPQALGTDPVAATDATTATDALAPLAQRVPDAAVWSELSHPWRPAAG